MASRNNYYFKKGQSTNPQKYFFNTFQLTALFCLKRELLTRNVLLKMAGKVKTVLREELEDMEEDPFDTMLQRSGCSEFHFKLQDCMFEKKDWRACQEEVKQFKACMDEQSKEKATSNSGKA